MFTYKILDVLPTLRGLHQFILFRIHLGHLAFALLDLFQHGIGRPDFSCDVAGVSAKALVDFLANFFRSAGELTSILRRSPWIKSVPRIVSSSAGVIF